MQGQVDDLRKIMVRDIDSLAERGERLELLIDRSENLEAGVSLKTEIPALRSPQTKQCNTGIKGKCRHSNEVQVGPLI